MQATELSEAIEYAKIFYDLDVTAQKLPGEYDDNFLVTSTDEQRYVLKIMHPDRQYAEIDLQCQILLHLEQKKTGLLLPKVQPASTGDYIVEIAADNRYLWLLSYIAKPLLAEAKPHLPHVLTDIGRKLGQLDSAMGDFTHPFAQREHKWDLKQAAWIVDYVDYIERDERQQLVREMFEYFTANALPALSNVRHSVIHGDANDYNVLVDSPETTPRGASGFIDLGDAIHTATICNLAIACAYAILGKQNPLQAASYLIQGYHEQYPLTDAEIRLLFPLICTRLCVSVTISAYRSSSNSDPYLVISEQKAWQSLHQLSTIHPNLAYYMFRDACNMEPVPHTNRIAEWLKSNRGCFHSIVNYNLRQSAPVVLDLSPGSSLLADNDSLVDTNTLQQQINSALRDSNSNIAVGRYNEARLIYQSKNFYEGDVPISKSRTIHIGLDLFLEPDEPVHAPLDGRVHFVGNNRERLDFGPLVILQHQTSQGDVFYTLYGHLKLSSIEHLHVGQLVKQGEIIARIGHPPENADWPPHVHFQIITDLLDLDNLFPGVVSSETQNVWLSLCPDPNLILDIPDECFPPTIDSPEETLIKRRLYTGRNLSLSYQKPLKIVRGWMQFLYDDTGRVFLDMYNNVPHVGHSHPHIVKAIQDQAALLNTNTRYLHDNLIHYAERLVGYMPDSLEVCYFLNSASEANELALRMARTYTQQEDVIVLENAYHGHTSTLIDISPYKFNGPGGSGNKPWVHVALMPDDYRGRFRRDDPDRGHKFALSVKEIIGQLEKSGTGLAAFIAETFPSVGGQIIPPPGYLKAAYHFVHEYGGVCIADEVQVGLGRLGQCFWGFQSQNVVPDIVVLGKPIGNSHPLAAVVTRREIADAFDNGMEFFSTFGGNPVSCAAGLAVLDVLEKDNLPANAERVGNYLKEQLIEMMKVFPVIGDVRGMGLFMGIELIQDQSTLEPAPRQATYIVNRLRDEGILVGTDGPFHNVIKMRPPLIFSEDDANLFLDKFRNILDEDGAKCG